MAVRARPLTLLDNVAVDGSGAAHFVDGGTYSLFVQATAFGGGSVSVESSVDGTTWITLSESGTPIALTGNAVRSIAGLSQGLMVRGTLTGSTAASGVTVTMA